MNDHPSRPAQCQKACDALAARLKCSENSILRLSGRSMPIKLSAAERDLIVAALSSQVEQSWMPIETAPTDGTEIIGLFHRRYDEDSPATVYGPWTLAWDGRKWRSSWDGSEVISSESDFGTQYKEPDIEPTHWMPMPEVPAVIKEGC